MPLAIMSPHEAAHASGAAFYSEYPLRCWSLFKAVKDRKKICGELRSLRFTWQAPEDGNTLPWLLDIGWELADAPLASLHRNGIYTLAEYANRVVAEIEINPFLPKTMPQTRYIKANFTEGHCTNQPLAGHFNVEGSVIADASGMKQFIAECPELFDVTDEMEVCKRIMQAEIAEGSFPSGPLHSREIFAILGDVK